jgi:ribose/xylose/arabinose/galactoside ABC-type transport system permease subunit
MKAYTREMAVAATIAVLMAVLAWSTHGYFSRENLTDLFLDNMPVMIIALGMTLIILTGQIDISVGSVFAVCSVTMGVLARQGHGVTARGVAVCLAGAACGAINGALVAYLRVPSIVVTLATMVALRDGLRWQTQGSWIGDLPERFQWLGLTQAGYTIFALAVVAVLIIAAAAGLHYLHAGRAVFATGSNEAAARIVGIRTDRVIFSVFTITGALTGLAAMMNSVRFHQIPSNSGLGLELRVIAAVSVGGAVITGGSGTILGTALGVVLLGSIGSALTFLGVSAYWENAIQGGIILSAVTINVLGSYRRRNAIPIDALTR